jgi:chromosome segregation ATPase
MRKGGVGMARAREEQEVRSALDSIQELLADGSQALIEGAQSVQRLLLATGRGVEGQVSLLLGTLESTLGGQLDALLGRFSASIRTEVDRITEQVRSIEERFGDAASIEDAMEDVLQEFLEPLRTLVNGADERARSSLARSSEMLDRIERLEHRISAMTAEPAEASADTEARLQTVMSALDDLRRDVGGRLTEVRERLTRIEGRVMETSKEQIARAGEATGMRDRLARLEARLTDLSREQVARAVESAGLRERVFRLEQRAGALATTASPDDPAMRISPHE